MYSVCFVVAQEDMSSEEFRSAVQAAVGIDDAQVDQLLDAFYQYEEEGDRSSFEALWSSDDDALRFVSTTMFLVLLEPEDIFQTAEALRHQYPENEVGIVSGLIGHSPEGVDYLLLNYDSYYSDGLSILLEALLKEPADSQEEWMALWESQCENYEVLVLGLQDPVVRRNLTLQANFNALRDVTDEFTDELPGLDIIGDTLSSMNDARELAMSEGRSEAACSGDRHFYFSQYDQALVSYRLAVEEDSKDVYAMYLMGCALFELGHYQNAVRVFDEVAGMNPSIVSAEYLSNLAARRSENGEEPLMTAAWLLAEEADLSERLGLMGGNDPMIQRLLGDQMLGKAGIYKIADSELLELARENEENHELVVGLLLMTNREQKFERLEQWSQLYPRNTLLKKAVFSFSQVKYRFGPHDTILDALASCRKLDTKNRYLLDGEIAWLGSRAEPLAEELFPEDWPDFLRDVTPLSAKQVALIRESASFSEYRYLPSELRNSVVAAMKHWSVAFRTIEGNSYSGGVWSQYHALFEQLKLSVELALEGEDYVLAEELLTYMERVTADLSENAIILIEHMGAQAFQHSAAELRAKANKAQKILRQEDLNVDDRYEESEIRQSMDLYLKDVVFEMLPLPSLRNEFSEISHNPYKYIEMRNRVFGELSE